MTRIDRLVVLRLVGSIGLTFLVLFGIVALAVGLDVHRLTDLAARGGIPLAALGVVTSTSKTVLSGFTVIILVGAVAGLLSLQSSREMTVIKASGRSVWRLAFGPVLAVVVLGFVLSFGVDALVVRADRSLVATPTQDQPLWLDGGSGDGRYILEARSVSPDGRDLTGVTVFMQNGDRTRIEADTGVLDRDAWLLPTATLSRADAPPRTESNYSLPTSMTPATVRARLQTIGNLTVFELGAALASGVADPSLHDSMLTRFLSKLALPASLAGSLLIAFAFTGGYRKTNNYGSAVLYGVVLGFVVYVVTEMAFRAGDAGVLAPPIAAFGPPFVAIVAGVTLLLFREDGRTT